MNETIIITRQQLELIFLLWCNDAKEIGVNFEEIELMEDEQIVKYSMECAEYIIDKHKSLT